MLVEAMHRSPLMLPATLPVRAGLSLTRDRCRSALVMDEADRLVGIVTLEDINQAISFGNSNASHQRLRVPLPT